MARITAGWSLERITVPVVGTTRPQNLRDNSCVTYGSPIIPFEVLIRIPETLAIGLMEGEVKYLEEP